MNRLWVRLSLIFSVAVIVSFITISLISFLIIRANLGQMNPVDRYAESDGLVDRLADFYQAHQTWDGVESLFAGVESVYRLRPGSSLSFALVDLDAGYIYGALPDADADSVDRVAVMIDGQVMAYLEVVFRSSGGLSRRWLGVVGPLGVDELILLVTSVGGVIGVLSGILISRWLTSPLDDLATAAADIGAGQLDRRVRVVGTEEVQSLARSFNQMVTQLERAEKLRRNLVGDVAHELRTPITALQANLYAILDDAYPMTKAEITGLYEQTRMLSRLVDDLHELSLAEAGQLTLDRKPVNLNATLEDFVAPFRSVAENKQIRFQLNLSPGLPPVTIDEERINQVLHNLFSNALRHTQAGGEISISVARNGAGLCVAVRDTGEGIPAEHLPNVFERFYRADFARSRQAGGSGLGLAIAKAIVEAHGGQVEVVSTGIAGEGTTFTVHLPLDVTSVE
jgi:two-component system OmpR family sensor kinase/two-component system sensor histidine kinase BaeS